MFDRLLRRLGAASGIFYVVLLILGSDVLGGTETGAGILVELLGFAFFPFFLGSLWTCLRSAEGDGGWLSVTAFGGGLVALAVKLASVAPILAVRASEGIDPGIAKALIAMNGASFVITFLPLAVMLSATAIVAIRTGVLPRWLGWVAAVVALGLLGALSAAVVSPSPPEWVFLPMLLFALWVVATSIALIRRAGEPHPVETAHLAREPARVR
ncbi:MAG: hypothetical protein H0X23_03800 [Rubrobacter sp.]|nr:hypothetical protein [Rubrobacter sp.]